MARYDIPIVFDCEEHPPRPCGTYRYTEEDTVVYVDPYGFRKYAPVDCVQIVTVTLNVPRVVETIRE